MAAAGPTSRRERKLLFASYHCYVDPSSGAAQSARDLLPLLAARGWQCRVFTGPHLDFEDRRPFGQLVQEARARLGMDGEARERPCVGAAVPCSLYELTQGGIPITVFDAPGTTPLQAPRREEGYVFLAFLEQELRQHRPDLFLTYGGHWLAQEMIACARRHEIPVVFWLHNCYYRHADFFRAMRGVIVPSRFAQEHYRRSLGLEFTPLPPPLDWSRLICPEVRGEYVTFVNPQPDKGVFYFAGIAQELHRRRPDIPVLVVEGRGKLTWLREAGLDLDRLGNVFGMATTPDPRAFYSVSRVVLMPSLWDETFGRVGAEALANGIPVLASRRGGLPEVLERAGFLFDVPPRYTPQTRLVPGADEVVPWVDTIIRLWDDADFYRAESERCRQAAEVWHPDRLAAAYDDYLTGMLPAPVAFTPGAGPAAGGPRLLFSSYHCYLDPSSGAAHSLRDLSLLLTARGWQCGVFTAAQLDFEGEQSFRQLAEDPRFRAQVISLQARPAGAPGHVLYEGMQGPMPVAVLDTPSVRPYQAPTREDHAAFLAHFNRVLDQFRPDVLVTYGSYALTRECMARAQRRGIAVVFWLRNCAYREADLFAGADGILVPSQFSRDYYRQTLGIDSTPIPSPVDWARVLCPQVEPRYATFVNPQPEKGVFFFAGIAQEAARRRPDIPFLVVEGRGRVRWLAETSIDLDRLGNFYGMGHTTDPREFYRVSRAVLMPSLWNETFGRVAVEALINGIPVLASRRGGLPEVLEQAGQLFDVPDRYTPQTRSLPNAGDVAPWVDALIRLWDDADFYHEQSQRCRAAAEAWRPEGLAAMYEEYFTRLLRRPAAALTVPESAGQAPAVSVVTPVHNGERFLDRAFRSLRAQTFAGWEWLVADDGSTDASYEMMCRHAAEDSRVRPLRLEVNSGLSAARNVALREARGRMVVYLDCDDEFYPDHLGRVAALADQAEVLVFGYDLIEDRQELPTFGKVSTYDPAPFREKLVAKQENIVVPLGVAHRRELLERSGPFNEAVLYNEDWDLWQRFVDAGATFFFVRHKCGLYHVRSDSHARTHRIPDAVARRQGQRS